MSYVTLSKINKMNNTEMEVDVNRLREHLVAFLAHHDPTRLQTSVKVDKMVRFAEEKGIEKLNGKLLHRFGDQVDTTTKLGTPKERILRLCKGFTPTLTKKLMEKAKIQPKLTTSLSKDFSNEDTELLNQIYFFYLEHNPEKLEHLAIFFGFAKEKGRDALNKILKASYDHELPPATNPFLVRDQKVHEHAQELMNSSKSRPSSMNSAPKMDLNLKNEIRDYFDEVDPSKLKAANTLYYWIELMGKEKASEIFLRLYGKPFAEGSTTEPIRILRKSRSNRKSGRLGDHSNYETPLPTKPSSSTNIRFKKNFDNTPPKVAREMKKSKLKGRSIQAPKQSLNPHVRHNSYADPFLAERRDSYLNSPALFMRNIPNIALIKEATEESSRRLNQSMRDFDDDSNDMPESDQIQQQHLNFDISEMMKKSPLGRLKEEDRDDSSFGSFVSSRDQKKPKKNFAHQLFHKFSPVAKKHRKPDFDLNNLMRLENIQKPENAYFAEHESPVRPHFDSVVASPVGMKDVHNVSKGREYLHGPNLSDGRAPSFIKNFIPDENEPLPIKSMKRVKEGKKRFSRDHNSVTIESTSPQNSNVPDATLRKISDVSKTNRPMKEIRRKKKNQEEETHQKGGCTQFVGVGRYCDQCGSDKTDHEWYAFDIPKALLDHSARAKNKNSPLLDDSEI